MSGYGAPRLALGVLALLIALAGSTPRPPVAAMGAVGQATPDVAQYVDPFIGTGWQNSGGVPDLGETFPGADVPFGMVQWSPDTVPTTSPSNGTPGYNYADSVIQGFSLTHLSGAGCDIFRDIPFMPVVGDVTAAPTTNASAYTSGFTHTNEQASPGYYGVTLDSGIQVGLTVTPRTGFGTFTYSSSSPGTMLIDAGGSANGDHNAAIQIMTTTNTVTGWASSGGFCGYASPYTIYFAAQFDQPFTRYGTWLGTILADGSDEATGPQAGAFVSFDTAHSPVIHVKVGVSFVSTQNALANLQAEDSGWDFDAVQQAARTAWNNLLGRIQVSGGTSADEGMFYTALYHTLLYPSVFSDANGQYIGFDNQIHATHAYTQYANFSGWDIYRSEIPLLAVLAPQQTSDMMQSLVTDAQQDGWLPKWPIANAQTNVMIGDSADPIVASAYAFGATGFDTGTALQLMIKGATQYGISSSGYIERPGLDDYENLGYVVPNTPGVIGMAANTLEYTTDDFALAQFARALGDTATYTAMMQRAQNWQNLFNPTTGYIEPRLADGEYAPWFTPLDQWGYQEGDAPQYVWIVPYNLHALFTGLGGNPQVVAKLDTFFTQLNAGLQSPYAELGDEPSFEIPWEYDFAGAPWRTQAVVRQALTQLFNGSPGGLPGNDDLGEMSSWYVWAALGMYPEIPGVGGLALDSPLFPNVAIHLNNGHDVQILAPGASDSTPYVQNLTVNGQPWPSAWLPFSALANGSTVAFTLGTGPATAWGAAPANAPPSFATGQAPAIPFATPGNIITMTAGSATALQIGAQNVTDVPTSVQWHAALPDGLALDASDGILTLAAGNAQTQSLIVTAPANTPPGAYLITIQMAAIPSAQQEVTVPITMPSMVVEVTVNPAIPTTETLTPTQTSLALPTATPPAPVRPTATFIVTPPIAIPDATDAVPSVTPTHSAVSGATPVATWTASPATPISTPAPPSPTAEPGMATPTATHPPATLPPTTSTSQAPYSHPAPTTPITATTTPRLMVHLPHTPLVEGASVLIRVQAAPGAVVRAWIATLRGQRVSYLHVSLRHDSHGRWRLTLRADRHAPTGLFLLTLEVREGSQKRLLTRRIRVAAPIRSAASQRNMAFKALLVAFGRADTPCASKTHSLVHALSNPAHVASIAGVVREGTRLADVCAQAGRTLRKVPYPRDLKRYLSVHRLLSALADSTKQAQRLGLQIARLRHVAHVPLIERGSLGHTLRLWQHDNQDVRYLAARITHSWHLAMPRWLVSL